MRYTNTRSKVIGIGMAVILMVLGAVSPVSAEFIGWTLADQMAINDELQILSDKVGPELTEGLTITLADPNATQHSCWSDLRCFGNLDYANNPKVRGLIVHEIGHRYFNAQKLSWADIGYSLGYYKDGKYIHVSGVNPQTGRYERTDLGYIEPNQPYCQHCSYMEPGGQSYREDFADMFMAWTMGYFSEDEAGKARQAFMDAFMGSHFPKDNPHTLGGVMPPPLEMSK